MRKYSFTTIRQKSIDEIILPNINTVTYYLIQCARNAYMTKVTLVKEVVFAFPHTTTLNITLPYFTPTEALGHTHIPLSCEGMSSYKDKKISV